MRITRVAVIGMGYVGIPAAVLFADAPGFEVVGVQRRSPRSGWKIDLLNRGGSPFPETEPEIGELIQRVALEKKTFRVAENPAEATNADAILIDVQTPVEADHAPRYDSLKEVAAQLGGQLRKGVLVCIESTVAPGTTVNMVKPILEERSGMRAGADFHLAFSYERVMVGRLLHNIRNYPRIVGGLTQACGEKAAELYRKIMKAPVVVTDCLTAEVAKTVENAYRDVNIAFANEIALICESLGVNVYEVRKLVNNLPNDPSNPGANPVRNLHLPGAGVGGHCLPKDSWLLKHGVDTYGRNPVETRLLVGARNLNDSMPAHMADLVETALKQQGVPVQAARIAVLGFAFLEQSDDTRNTPAIPFIESLRSRGIGEIVVHDPFVRSDEQVRIETDLHQALRNADCACILTRHKLYLDFEWTKAARLMRHPIIVDGRDAIPPKRAAGCQIIKVGVGEAAPRGG
jgi:UDP-N-acetyl-D-mannosaminuronic acid dehydrogenase